MLKPDFTLFKVSFNIYLTNYKSAKKGTPHCKYHFCLTTNTKVQQISVVKPKIFYLSASCTAAYLAGRNINSKKCLIFNWCDKVFNLIHKNAVYKHLSKKLTKSPKQAY